MRPRRFLLYGILGILLAGQAVRASGAVLQGRVRSAVDREPLPYAVVRVLDLGIQTETDSEGRFGFPRVSPGTHRVATSLVGYRPYLGAFAVADSDSVAELDLVVDPVAFALPVVTVSAPPPGAGAPAHSLTRESLARTPGTADDLSRAIQTLPGIVTTDVNSSFLSRGGGSDEVGFYLDGIQIPEPYHLRENGGTLSVLSLQGVEQARVRMGGVPARYGEDLSGVVDLQGASVPLDRVHGSLGLEGVQTREQLSAPLGGGASLLVVHRHGLLDVISRSVDFVEGATVKPSFDDVLARVRLPRGSDEELEVLAIGSHDDDKWDDPYVGNDYTTRAWNVTTGLRWVRRWSERVHQTSVISADYLERRSDLVITGKDDDLTRGIRARTEAEFALGDHERLGAGAFLEAEGARLNFVVTDVGRVMGEYYEYRVAWIHGTAARRRIGSWASLDASLGERWSVSSGVNAAYDDYSWDLAVPPTAPHPAPGGLAFQPRLAFAYRIGGRTTARASMALMRQPVELNRIEADRVDAGLGRDHSAQELNLGLESDLWGWRTRADLYERRSRGLDVPPEDRGYNPDGQPYPDRGTARGIELSVQGPSRRRWDVAGSYTLAKATWEMPTGNVPRSLDVRQTATAALNVRPFRRINANATVRYHTGAPYTKEDWYSWGGGCYWDYTLGPFNGARYPDFFRLDLGLSHPMGQEPGAGRVFLELINVTDHSNVLYYSNEFEETGSGCRTYRRVPIEMFPRLPLLGFEFPF